MNTFNNLNNFFHCLSLQTLVLNSDFKTVHVHNHNSNVKSAFYNSKAIDYLKTYTDQSNILTITICNDVKYTVIIFNHYDNKPMYILIGPYNLKIDNLDKSTMHINDDDTITINKLYLDNFIEFYSNMISKRCQTQTYEKSTSPCVNRAIEYIKENYKKEISIDTLCKELNINKCYFCSIFKKETDLTFINYLNKYKIDKSKELLSNTKLSLLDVAISVGFNNQSYYSTVFKKMTNKTPLEYRDSL